MKKFLVLSCMVFMGLFAKEVEKESTPWTSFYLGINGGIAINQSKAHLSPTGRFLTVALASSYLAQYPTSVNYSCLKAEACS